eukprot:jgi/Chlat1/8890/Chrsp92S08205
MSGSRGAQVCRDFQRGRCRYGRPALAAGAVLPAHKQQQQQAGLSHPLSCMSTIIPTPHVNQHVIGRFGALADERPSNSGRHSHGRDQQQQPSKPEHRCDDARECKQVVDLDLKDEKPVWRLSAYGHLRWGQNHINGDTSPEELRYTAYESAKSGKPLAQIAQEERSLVSQKDSQFAALLRTPARDIARAVIPATAGQAFGSNSTGRTVFGQTSQSPASGTLFGKAFGQAVISATTPAPVFSQQTTSAQTGIASFGQASFGGQQQPQQGSLFGQTTFGGQQPQQPQQGTLFGRPIASQQQQAPVFGQTPPSQQQAVPFGQLQTVFGQAAPSPSPSPFASTLTPTPVPSTPTPFGQPAAAVSAQLTPPPLVFGLASLPQATLQQPQQSPQPAFASPPFAQQPNAASPFTVTSSTTESATGFMQPLNINAAANGAPSAGVMSSSAPVSIEDAWRATAFKLGQIPEAEPPGQYCR